MRIISAVVTIFTLINQALAGFEYKVSEDALDPKKKFSYAITPSNEQFQQSGQPVQAWLVVMCSDTYAGDGSARKFKQLGAHLQFSERVAIADRMIRWRIDENKVVQKKERFWNDGKTFYLMGPGTSEVVPQLRKAKAMKVEADLPWAGKVILTFDATGASEAFAKIPCR